MRPPFPFAIYHSPSRPSLFTARVAVSVPILFRVREGYKYGWLRLAGTGVAAPHAPAEGRAYSYRSASIGSRRDALMAGNKPKNIPTLAEKPMPMAKDHQGSETGKPVSQ